jgi:DNA-directed RNA polymerase specialized sigma subunit
MTMRTLDISMGGLKLESNFDLGAGELIDFAILTDGDRIQCKGRILEVEESRNKVQARLQFTPTSDWEHGKLSRYLHAVARKPLRGEAMSDSKSSVLGTTRHAMRRGVELVTGMFKEKDEDRKLQMVNSWLALLTDMEKAVITLRFGFNGEDIHTPESIGARFGLTPEAICQIEAEAIEKLQRMSQKKDVDLDDVI